MNYRVKRRISIPKSKQAREPDLVAGKKVQISRIKTPIVTKKQTKQPIKSIEIIHGPPRKKRSYIRQHPKKAPQDLQKPDLAYKVINKPNKPVAVIGRRSIRESGAKGILRDKRDKLNRIYTKHQDKIRNLKNSGQKRVLVIVACGPSVKEAPLEILVNQSNIDFMAINQPYGYYQDGRCPEAHYKLWPMKFWAFCDNSQHKRNMPAWDKYNGVILNSSAVKGRHKNQIVIKNKGGKGFSKDLLVGYHIGRSSTFAAMQAAFYMDYDKIYIFGVDMCAVDGKLHHYGQNPDVQNERRMERFEMEAGHYSHAAKQLSPQERKKFIFCSSYNPWPFVDKFARLNQQEAPYEILEYANNIS